VYSTTTAIAAHSTGSTRTLQAPSATASAAATASASGATPATASARATAGGRALARGTGRAAATGGSRAHLPGTAALADRGSHRHSHRHSRRRSQRTRHRSRRRDARCRRASRRRRCRQTAAESGLVVGPCHKRIQSNMDNTVSRVSGSSARAPSFYVRSAEHTARRWRNGECDSEHVAVQLRLLRGTRTGSRDFFST